MPFWKLLGGSAVALACWGTVAQPTTAHAADSKGKAAKTASAKSSVSDVALNRNGALVGQVVDGQGKPLDGAAVSVKQGSKEVASAVTDEKGNFSVSNVRGGVYQITSGEGTGTYRVWTADAAPPAARQQALVVSKPEAVRGQVLGGISAATAAGTTGAVAGGVGAGLGGYSTVRTQQQKDQLDKANNTINQLQDQLNSIQSSP